MTQQLHSWVHTQEKWKHIHTETYTFMSIAASFIVAQRGNNLLNKRPYSSTGDCYWAVKRSEVPVHLWMKPQNVMLRGSQTQRPHVLGLCLWELPRRGKCTNTENWGRGGWAGNREHPLRRTAGFYDSLRGRPAF